MVPDGGLGGVRAALRGPWRGSTGTAEVNQRWGTRHKKLREALEGTIESVAIEVNLLREDLRKVSGKMRIAEGSIVELELEMGNLWRQVEVVTSKNRTFEAWIEDAEGKSRRNNVRLLDFPERAEGVSTEKFVENWIRSTLQPKGLSSLFTIDREHHALVAHPKPGAPPRAIIAHILNYKVCVLPVARETNSACIENQKISIYPDYTSKVQTSRKGFMEVKVKLRTMGIRYMLLYPTRLCVISEGKSHFFDIPQEIWQWLEIWDKVPRSRLGSSRSAGTMELRRSAQRHNDNTALVVGPLLTVDVPRRMVIQDDGTMAVTSSRWMTPVEESSHTPDREGIAGSRPPD
ncbi:hypothetical protein NDU88_002554 [Pleurodeles waltl]|uniref:Uncharacterized protein n=1 Tax=Pleurodeles waltl TaxID=8319 RepID=A0AAV7U9K7_PLEWA|nr:hypothetical protein NDU88_002554 [Pleurodeles waltl]